MTALNSPASTGLRLPSHRTAPRSNTLQHTTTRTGISLPVAIAIIAAVATNLRPGIVSVGPVLGLLRSEFHLNNAQAALLTAIPTLLMGLLAIPTPWLARRFGRNNVVLAALSVLGLATLLRAFSTSAVVLLLATGGVGAGIAVAGALISGFVKAHHPGRVSLLMGLYAASLGLGSTVAAAVTGPVAALMGGWRVAMAIWGLPGLAAMAAWAYVARAEAALPSPVRAVAQVVHVHPVRSRAAWLTAIYFAANNFLFFGLLAWFVPMNMEFGASAERAGLMLAAFTTVFMFSNPVPAWISQGTDRRLAIGLFASAFLLGMALMIAAPQHTGWLPIVLLAFGIGGSFSLGMTLPLDHTVDADQANTWTSFTLAIGYGLGALGPLSIGLVRDLTHSFAPALWLLAAVGALKLLLAPLLRPQHQNA